MGYKRKRQLRHIGGMHARKRYSLALRGRKQSKHAGTFWRHGRQGSKFLPAGAYPLKRQHMVQRIGAAGHGQFRPVQHRHPLGYFHAVLAVQNMGLQEGARALGARTHDAVRKQFDNFSVGLVGGHVILRALIHLRHVH